MFSDSNSFGAIVLGGGLQRAIGDTRYLVSTLQGGHVSAALGFLLGGVLQYVLRTDSDNTPIEESLKGLIALTSIFRRGARLLMTPLAMMIEWPTSWSWVTSLFPPRRGSHPLPLSACST